MTERLYYTDSYVAEFGATVLSLLAMEDGRTGAILDRTAFYPTSGGQPFDTGTLGSARVVDVIDRAGDIVHVIEGELAPGPVKGRIDWPRRFDHMQQHTGQHVLSAAFDRLLRARTESFHLGSVSSTIDLSRDLSPADVSKAEEEANRVMWSDLPVAVRFVSSGEAAALPLRKEALRGGVLRLIEIDEVDLSACGGTHVRRTGEVGLIAVGSTERFRGGTRLEFFCGGRALRHYRGLRESVLESVRRLSVLPAELPAAIERLQAEGRELKRSSRDLQNRLAAFVAQELVDQTDSGRSPRFVVAALEGWDPNGLKAIAARIADRPGCVAVLFGLPEPASVVVARSADVGLDSGGALKQLMARLGGKGGGRPELAQGGGLAGSRAELLAAARSLVSEG